MPTTALEWKDRAAALAWADRVGIIWANRESSVVSVSAIEIKLYTALTASATLTGFVSYSIFPDHAMQGATLPSVVYNRVSGVRINSMSGYSGLENPRFQFDVYSTAVDALADISDAIIGALASSTTFKAVPSDSPDDDWDDDVGIYRRMFDVSIWNQE